MIYVCGDSFAVSDPEYGPCWVDMLAEKTLIVNLAQVAATNLLIAKQVDLAIESGAKFVILLCTSVTRGEKKVGNKYVPFSYHTAGRQTTPFSDQQLLILKNYYTEFFDLDLAIYQNKITIEHTLQKLEYSTIPFCFDQGGFEHVDFAGSRADYFLSFSKHRSAINLWDFPKTRCYRPYYHIPNRDIHRQVADYYLELIGACI